MNTPQTGTPNQNSLAYRQQNPLVLDYWTQLSRRTRDTGSLACEQPLHLGDIVKSIRVRSMQEETRKQGSCAADFARPNRRACVQATVHQFHYCHMLPSSNKVYWLIDWLIDLLIDADHSGCKRRLILSNKDFWWFLQVGDCIGHNPNPKFQKLFFAWPQVSQYYSTIVRLVRDGSPCCHSSSAVSITDTYKPQH